MYYVIIGVMMIILTVLSLLRKMGIILVSKSVCKERFDGSQLQYSTNYENQVKGDVPKGDVPKGDVPKGVSESQPLKEENTDSKSITTDVKKDPKPIDIEWGVNDRFGEDNPMDINLIMSGLNDCYAVIGTGDGKRDLYDFSDRFITAQFDASNDIPVFSYVNDKSECK